METVALLIALLAGFTAGFAIAWFLASSRFKTAEKLLSEKDETIEHTLEGMKSAFAELGLNTLKQINEDLVSHTKTALDGQFKSGERLLDGKKDAINTQVEQMKSELERVTKLMRELERDREAKFSSVSEQIVNMGMQSEKLLVTANKLNEALTSTGARGRWGERMADDVLQAIGMQEGVSYTRQTTMQSGKRPDFTFYMPDGRMLNMDVKFPFNSYLRYLEAESETEKKAHIQEFLKDVRNKIKDVAGKEYINRAEDTLDFAIIFIPNEAVFQFIMEHDQSIIDRAFEAHIAFCSPVSLFAVLAVVKQAAENFTLEQTSDEILKELSKFSKQWGAFCDKLDNMGKKIDDARKEYDTLITTRRNMLEKPLMRLEDIRQSKGLSLEDDNE